VRHLPEDDDRRHQPEDEGAEAQWEFSTGEASKFTK
jgi:hypothetical protein